VTTSIATVGLSPFLTQPQRRKSIETKSNPLLQKTTKRLYMFLRYIPVCRNCYNAARAFHYASFDLYYYAIPPIFAHSPVDRPECPVPFENQVILYIAGIFFLIFRRLLSFLFALRNNLTFAFKCAVSARCAAVTGALEMGHKRVYSTGEHTCDSWIYALPLINNRLTIYW
jgi:hypothetical protein